MRAVLQVDVAVRSEDETDKEYNSNQKDIRDAYKTMGSSWLFFRNRNRRRVARSASPIFL